MRGKKRKHVMQCLYCGHNCGPRLPCSCLSPPPDRNAAPAAATEPVVGELHCVPCRLTLRLDSRHRQNTCPRCGRVLTS